MSTPTPTKKRLQTRHADDAARMAERLPGDLYTALCLRLGLDCDPMPAGQAAEQMGVSTVKHNQLYERAVDLLVTAVDSENVAAEDIPDLLIVGWMRRDDEAPPPDPSSRRAIDAVMGGTMALGGMSCLEIAEAAERESGPA